MGGRDIHRAFCRLCGKEFEALGDQDTCAVCNTAEDGWLPLADYEAAFCQHRCGDRQPPLAVGLYVFEGLWMGIHKVMALPIDGIDVDDGHVGFRLKGDRIWYFPDLIEGPARIDGRFWGPIQPWLYQEEGRRGPD